MVNLNFSEQWVRKFEKEYEQCYITSSVGDEELDTEAEFEALLKQHQYKENLTEDYASKKFDASIPQHRLLDTTTVRNKVKLNHRKSFQEKKNNLLKTTSSTNRENSVLSYNAASPKLSSNLTNSARNSKVTKKVCLNDEVSQTKGSLIKNESSCDQNEYEDVKVFKKRTKKKKQGIKEPEIFVSSVKNVEVKYSPEGDDTKMAKLWRDSTTETIPELEVDHKEVARPESVSVSPKAPFERFQTCLFSLFTLCVPWSCMKRVYWKSNTKKQDNFSTISRRNSRSRRP